MPHNTTRNQRRTVDPRRMKAVAVACIIIVLGVVTTHRHTGNPAPLFLDEVYTRGLPEDTPALVSSSVKANSSSSPSYQLAFEQSGGFFDDISDSSWKRLQQIARRTWPNHFSKDLQQYANHPTKDKSNWWNAENFQEEFHCQFAERLPSDSNGDGPKWVCDPHRIAQQQAPCLVYSVGSNGNVMFEKAVKQQISPDCEIHTFDLTTYNKRNGDFAQALKGYATFHNWGLGTAEQAATKKNFKTLEQTVKALGHEGRRIDVFKIGTYVRTIVPLCWQFDTVVGDPLFCCK